MKNPFRTFGPVSAPLASALGCAKVCAQVCAQAYALAGALSGTPARAADAPPAWEKAGGVPAENAFLLDRAARPWNGFLRNSEEGFVAGREFYQEGADAPVFLWPDQPFRRFGEGREWMADTSFLSFAATGSQAPGDVYSPLSRAEAAWSPFDELRLHASLDQNGLYSPASRSARAYFAGPGNAEEWALFGDDAPLRSQASLGAAYSRRGGVLGLQANRGWWWTTSPVTGRPYPWRGFNFDMQYGDGESFALTLVEQRWDSPSPFAFDRAHWRRSEVNLGFNGASDRAWVWRLDLGFAQRALSSQGVFRDFDEKSYPFRFRYRQDWKAPDSLPLRVVSDGSIGYREGRFLARHTTEFREGGDVHRPMQYLKAYYRYAFRSAVVPTEYLGPDSLTAGSLRPGRQNRGLAAGAEYREVRKRFLAGLRADYAMEWELPLFQGTVFDTVEGLRLREGGYAGSRAWAANAGGSLFASGAIGKRGNWRLEAGLRRFFGPDADDLEFLPSPWWVAGGAGYGLPWNGAKTRLDFRLAYVGPKEVRHWGPVHEVAAHAENHVSLVQSFFGDRLRLTAAALHAFGDDLRDLPDGNPVRFRVAAGLEGTLR